MSPKAWKASFSEFHRSYNPKSGQRFSFRSPDKPRHSSLSRDSSTLGVSSQSATRESLSSESRDLDTGSSHSEIHSSSAEEDTAAGTAVNELGEVSNQAEEEKGLKEEESEPKPPAESDHNQDGEKTPSESSSELNNSCDSESLELQLSAADNGPLHIEETEDSPADLNAPKPNGLENGEVSGFKDLSGAHKVCQTPLCMHCLHFFFRGEKPNHTGRRLTILHPIIFQFEKKLFYVYTGWTNEQKHNTI